MGGTALLDFGEQNDPSDKCFLGWKPRVFNPGCAKRKETTALQARQQTSVCRPRWRAVKACLSIIRFSAGTCSLGSLGADEPRAILNRAHYAFCFFPALVLASVRAGSPTTPVLGCWVQGPAPPRLSVSLHVSVCGRGIAPSKLALHRCADLLQPDLPKFIYFPVDRLRISPLRYRATSGASRAHDSSKTTRTPLLTACLSGPGAAVAVPEYS